MLYTHNWALFFGAATGIAWLWLLWRAGRQERRRLLRTGLVAYGGVVLLYVPWIPTALYQAAHTGAPWSQGAVARRARLGPGADARRGRRGRRLPRRRRRRVALLRTRGAARPRDRLRCSASPCSRSCSPGSARRSSPAWANRYLAAGVAPFLLLAAAGFAHAGRLGLVGLALVAVLWAIDGAPDEKSNVRDVAAGDRAVAAPRRPRGRDAARAGLGARLLPARTGCATRRSPGRSATPA